MDIILAILYYNVRNGLHATYVTKKNLQDNGDFIGSESGNTNFPILFFHRFCTDGNR